jgi:hypothetical protein
MIRRFNYTGRKRIFHQHAQIFIRTDDGSASFDANINLNDYALPSDAKVYVEAYRQTSWMRFDFGTVAALVPPVDRCLARFESFEDILFRVRVVSEKQPHGRLIAEGDKIRLRHPQEQEVLQRPLLPVISKNLQGQISRIDFEDRPRLEINAAVGNWRELARNPAFRSMVLSYAVKEILTRILLVERYFDTDTDDPDDWSAQWLRYVSSLPGVGHPPGDGSDQDPIDEWIESAVSAFGRKHGVLDWFNIFWQGEET